MRGTQQVWRLLVQWAPHERTHPLLALGNRRIGGKQPRKVTLRGSSNIQTHLLSSRWWMALAEIHMHAQRPQTFSKRWNWNSIYCTTVLGVIHNVGDFSLGCFGCLWQLSKIRNVRWGANAWFRERMLWAGWVFNYQLSKLSTFADALQLIGIYLKWNVILISLFPVFNPNGCGLEGFNASLCAWICIWISA